MRSWILAAVLALDPRLLGLDDVTPRDAAYLAALEVGRPELGPELERVCMRESRCRPIGVHEIDGLRGETFWRRAVRQGWLAPALCDAHAMGDPARWTTRGAFGAAAAYSLHRLPELGACVGPEVMDHPGPAALAAARFAVSCDRFFGTPCTCADRTKLWMGPGVWAVRTYADRRARVERQCGPQPPLRVWQVLADFASAAWHTSTVALYASALLERWRPRAPEAPNEPPALPARPAAAAAAAATTSAAVPTAAAPEARTG